VSLKYTYILYILVTLLTCVPYDPCRNSRTAGSFQPQRRPSGRRAYPIRQIAVYTHAYGETMAWSLDKHGRGRPGHDAVFQANIGRGQGELLFLRRPASDTHIRDTADPLRLCRLCRVVEDVACQAHLEARAQEARQEIGDTQKGARFWYGTAKKATHMNTAEMDQVKWMGDFPIIIYVLLYHPTTHTRNHVCFWRLARLMILCRERWGQQPFLTWSTFSSLLYACCYGRSVEVWSD